MKFALIFLALIVIISAKMVPRKEDPVQEYFEQANKGVRKGTYGAFKGVAQGFNPSS